MPDMNRRSLLMKLSAGLALGATLPPSAWASLDKTGSRVANPGQHGDLTGIWHSRYTYFSSGRNAEFTGEHYVVLREDGGSHPAQVSHGGSAALGARSAGTEPRTVAWCRLG